MKLSIIIPVYNEINTIEIIVNIINNLDSLNKEIIIVDDCSTDGTAFLLKNSLYKKVDKVIFHDKNLGKGSAIRTAKKFISGDIVIIQDADLEYDPNDYYNLIKPIISKQFNVVYGSRVLGKKRYSSNNFSSNFRVFCNHVLTILSNIINNQKLTDAHTCYKVFSKKFFDKIILEENGFSFCPEITTKISLNNYKILEVPINYKGRSYDEGKKISFADGFYAIKTLIKYRYFK